MLQIMTKAVNFSLHPAATTNNSVLTGPYTLFNVLPSLDCLLSFDLQHFVLVDVQYIMHPSTHQSLLAYSTPYLRMMLC